MEKVTNAIPLERTAPAESGTSGITEHDVVPTLDGKNIPTGAIAVAA